MKMTASILVLAIFAAAFASVLGAPAPAPAPSGKTSPCTLPNGAEILAPEASGTAAQYYYYYYSYSWVSYSYYYYSSWGRKLLETNEARKLLQSSSAPAPSSAPRCCPETTTKAGDTVSGLISSAGLPEDSKAFFYAINPNVRNGTDSLTAGTAVTVPCFRITEYNRLRAAGSPSVAPSQPSTTGK